jgi:hypothetical protein
MLARTTTDIDAYALVNNRGEVIRQKGFFTVQHRTATSTGMTVSEPTSNTDGREEYYLRFDRNMGNAVLNVDALSREDNIQGKVMSVLVVPEGKDLENRTLVKIVLSQGSWLSLMAVY